ncbi:MAG: pyridoxine 5'-phosphate synthase [Alphaproteobacteria bacterium]|nr:pyridoxine 5'-phosphate synthase [Alphaproteobacteria bacterium]
MPTALSVNVNKIALLRNQRHTGMPSVVGLARRVLDAGADGITVHPRPDQRHIRESDVPELSEVVAEYRASGRSEVEFNVEGYPDERFLTLVERVKPHQVTLVPDAPDQATSDHGWDLPGQAEMLAPVVARLKSGGMRVALFADPLPAVMEGAKAVGADRVELYTGPYFDAHLAGQRSDALEPFVAAATLARSLGLGVNAGHDLTLENLGAFCAAIPWLAEVSIGHAITADALDLGFAGAVRAYRGVIHGVQSGRA